MHRVKEAARFLRKKKPIVSVALTIIVLLASAAYFNNVVSSITTPILHSSSSSASTCGMSFDVGPAYPSSILVLSVEATGRICVEYRNSLNNSISLPTYIRVYRYNSSAPYGGQLVVDSEDFEVNASQSSVEFNRSSDPYSEVANVIYSIRARSHAPVGVYGLFLLQFCDLFPVGIAPSDWSPVHFSRSDFSSWYPHNGSCPAIVTDFRVLGVSGFRVAWVWF